MTDHGAARGESGPEPPPSAAEDTRFRHAVAAIDAGEAEVLRQLIDEHPTLVTHRLVSPGPWLREQVGDAIDGFFRDPWLLWFVADDPIRIPTLPPAILEIVEVLVDAARRYAPHTLQDQLDGALRLTSWSPVAARCGVQLAMMDALAAAGAKPTESPDQALVNGHRDAAERLIAWGAPVTLGAAACLGRWQELPMLFSVADPAARQAAFVLASLNGSAGGVRRMIELGIPVDAPSETLYSHGTPLHHAVASASLETVLVLTAAGADIHRRDAAWGATPLGWAEHMTGGEQGERRATMEAIANHLRSMGEAGP